MYENQTYQVILRRMLSKVETWAQGRGITIDTREGSLIRTALSPAAAELQQMYIELDQVLNESFADTESQDFLIRRAAERGIIVEPATYAIRRGMFNMDVPIGSRFSLNKLNYAVTEQIGFGTFRLQCETAGVVGNLESGDLIPIEYIEGLTNAALTDVLIPGEEEEDTERLRVRYFNSLNALAYGGNIQDYVEKVSALNGVGGVKIYPVWQGGGTVKVVVLNSDFQVPSDVLINEVQTVLDPIPNQGLGLGIAPIGRTVTVVGAGEEMIQVNIRITFAAGYTWEQLLPYIETAIDEYFEELAQGWDSVDWRIDRTATLIVRIAQIEARILDIQGVVDVGDTKLNNQAANWILGVDHIAIRGAVTNV